MTTYGRVKETSDKLIKRLVDFSGLKRPLVCNIVHFAACLCKPDTEQIDDLIFIAVLSRHFGISGYLMNSLIFDACKTFGVPYMTIEECARCFCLFLSTDLEIKINFVFRVYDINKDNVISHGEVYTLLKSTVVSGHEDEDEQEEAVKDLVEIVITNVDMDNNREIDLNEFRSLVKKNVLYIELLGQCLPSPTAVKRFTELMSHKTPLQIKKAFENERFENLNEHRPPMKKSYYPILLESP